MAEFSTRWWGIIIGLNTDEACFISAPRTVQEQLFNLIPPPWGQIAAATVIANKAWIRRNIGNEGTDLHLNWGGVIHWVARRGDPSSCLGESAFSELRVRPLSVTVEQPSGITAALEGGVGVQGDIFQDVNSFYAESLEKGQLLFEIRNRSGEWISVDVIRRDGVDKTHRIPDGQDDSINQDITQYTDPNFQCRVIRWRPGFLGLPGSGGGQILFTVPESAGSGVLSFTVVG